MSPEINTNVSGEYRNKRNNSWSRKSLVFLTGELAQLSIKESVIKTFIGTLNFNTGHVSISIPGLNYRKSWENSIDGEISDEHWTNQNVGKKHPERHKALKEEEIRALMADNSQKIPKSVEKLLKKFGDL